MAILSGLPEDCTSSDVEKAMRLLGNRASGPSAEQRAAWKQARYLRGAATAIALGVALWSAHVVLGARDEEAKLTLSLGLAWLFWSVAPPAWFLFEYNWIWPRTGGDFEDLKYGQELAKAIWVGIAAVLLVMLTGWGR